MYKNLMGERVSVIVATRGDNILEYIGTLTTETGGSIELTDVEITYFMLAAFQFQKQMFGNLSTSGRNVDKVIINKDYIISCNR